MIFIYAPPTDGIYDSLKGSSSKRPYGSLNEPDAYDSLKRRPDAADPYGSLKEPDPYGSLKEPDATGAHDSLKGLISNAFNQTYMDQIERKNAQLVFCSNSLLKLSVLYLLGTTPNQSYPYLIGRTFIFFTKTGLYLTTLSLYLTTTESLSDDIAPLFDDNDSINGDYFKLIPTKILERKYS